MRQRRKKQNACLRLLCCLCNSIIEAEKGERSPPPPSPPRAIVRRPSRPPQKPTQPTMPPLDDIDRKMIGSPSYGPPIVDDNRPFISSDGRPPPPLSSPRPIDRRPSRPPQEPPQPTRPPLDDIDRKMFSFPSFGPPVVDDNRPFVFSGERPPPPLSPPPPIIRRPSRPTIVGPRPPLDEDGRKMADFSHFGPPLVDYNGPFISSMSLPRVQNPEEDMRPVQPSGNGPWAGSNEKHEVSAPGSGSGLSIPFDRPPDV